MDKNLLSKLLNDNKRFEVVKKDFKKTLKVILKAFNNKKIVSETSSLIDGLKRNTTIIFKPVKAFTKKAIKGLNKFDLAQQRLEAEEERRKQKEKVLGNKEKPSKKQSYEEELRSNNGFQEKPFVNWFDLTGNQEEPVKAKVMSIKKADGSIVPLISTKELDEQFD